MYFLQTSAKSCDNVDRLFTEIAHELLQQVFEFAFLSSVRYFCEIDICCRQRRRTYQASRTACRTYLTQLGKTPRKWSRTAVQKSSELWSSKISPWILGDSFQTSECPRIRRRWATCRWECTFWKYFPIFPFYLFSSALRIEKSNKIPRRTCFYDSTKKTKFECWFCERIETRLISWTDWEI